MCPLNTSRASRTMNVELSVVKKTKQVNSCIPIETRRKLFNNLRQLFHLYGITSERDIVLLLYTQYLFNKEEAEPCIPYQIWKNINNFASITSVSFGDMKTVYNRLNKLEKYKLLIKPTKKAKATERRQGNPFIPLPLEKLIGVLAQKKALECKIRVQKLKEIRDLSGSDALETQLRYLLSDDKYPFSKIFMYIELNFWKERKNIESMRLCELKCLKELRKRGKKDDAIVRIVNHLKRRNLIKTDSPIDFNTTLTPVDIRTIFTQKMKELITETKEFYETYPFENLLRRDSITLETINTIFDEEGR